MNRNEFKLNLVRRFNGKEYTLDMTYRLKSHAKTRASFLRRNGWNVRIVERKSQKNKYALFRRKK